MLKSSRESIEVCKRLRDGAAQCQLFKFDSISALSYWIFNTIGLARTSQEYHKRFLRTDKNYNFCINSIKMLFNILKIKPIFGDFITQYRFSVLIDAGSSIARIRFWVHIRCWFNVLKYRAALLRDDISGCRLNSSKHGKRSWLSEYLVN